MRFQRSGFTGAGRCAQVVWSGDPTVGWDFDGLAVADQGRRSRWGCRGSARGAPTSAASSRSAQRELSDELLMRWVQFGAVSPVMRMQRNGVAFPEKDRPAGGGRRPDRELAPLREAAHPAPPLPRGGRPRLPQDGTADHAAPRARLSGRRVLARRARTSTCSGRTCWPRRWSSRARPSASCTSRRGAGSTSGARVAYREKRGGLRLRRARVLAGGHEETVPAPLEELPLMVRAGAVLPLLPADVDTLAVVRAGAGRGAAVQAPRPARPDRLPARALARHVLPRGEAAVDGPPTALGPRDPRQAHASLPAPGGAPVRGVQDQRSTGRRACSRTG